MILGSHNSMTYLKPKKWYLYPFQFIARCQNLNIEEQYNYGVRVFDIRLSFDKKGNVEFRHGLMAYKGDVYRVFDYLNSVKEPVIVRILLEVDKVDPLKEDRFKATCRLLEEVYPKIKFYGGFRKFDKMPLYNFRNERPNMIEIYSSYQLPKIDDLFPYLYAKKHNKDAKEIDTEYLMLDFVQLG